MSSKRQNILDYISETLFGSITIAGGYNFDVQTKSRGLKSLMELPDSAFPALFVASADERRQDSSNVNFESIMSVHIYGAVKAAENVVQVELDKLIADLTKAIYTDPNMNDNVIWSSIKSVVTDEGDNQPHAFFEMLVEMQYISVGTVP